jgi:hypothetical protein
MFHPLQDNPENNEQEEDEKAEVIGTKLGSPMYPGPDQTMSKQLTPFYMLSLHP